MSEEIKEAPDGVLEQGDFKIKKKKGRPRKLVKDEPVLKVDLAKKEEPKEEEVKSETIEETPQEAIVEEVVEKKQEEEKQTTEVEEESVIQEIKEEDTVAEEEKINTTQEQVEQPKINNNLPEGIEKLVEFMKETGGTVEDYVRLNTDYTSIDDTALLNEYYKTTKPHLDLEERNFLIKDNFSYDEEVDEERDIRKKKIAYKEEIAKAKNFLEQTKSKYYQEIKLRPGVTQEQQKAMDFFNRYNENKQRAEKQHKEFLDRTNKYFSEGFKGFEFNLGEKKFKYSIKNAQDVAKEQSELKTFVQKFLNEDGSIKDHEGYHKAMYAARNADTIARHFYEQGKTDGVKEVVNKSKNINASSRPQNNEDIFINGFKVKAISGVDSSKLKIQTKKKI
tara:strand:+ start:1104 stop:2279 length:1176 start_codon:yes stop_codon:yes gene_type:complete